MLNVDLTRFDHWRISPEEKHSANVGYPVDEMLSQTKQAVSLGIDYLNISMNLPTDYSNTKRPSYDTKVKGTDQTFVQYFRPVTGDLPIYIGSNVLTADDALTAANDADGVYLARELLMDPAFATKIATGKADQIVPTTSIEALKAADLPADFVANYANITGKNHPVSYRRGIPLPGLD